MESPVMTSASSHRLRSAVSACAQPTHSYLNSSYLSTSIQVESHNSGGCLKKFYESGKNGKRSPSNVDKKPHSSTDYAPLHKRYKTCARNTLDHRQKIKSDGVLGLKPFTIGNDLLSKLSLGRRCLDPNALTEFRGGPAAIDSVSGGRDKVIDGKISGKNGKKPAVSDGVRNGKVLSHRQDGCSKAKSKKRATDCVPEENELSEEWSKCVVAPSDRRDISKCQPRQVATRRTTHSPREIRNASQSTVGFSKSVPAESVCPQLQELQHFPSAPPVTQMLNYATECPGKPPTLELCRIDKERIKPGKVCKVTRVSPATRIPDKDEEKRPRISSKGMSKYEVFLGGSCNPTTWRTDFAIPELQRMGISYYNPQQVEEWRPELLEVEYHAKENATVMFFVLDNQTRGVSALIEVAHLAGNQRKLILVVQSYTQKNQIICDEEISQEEYEDLKTGQEVLQDLMERQGIPVFDDIQVALECTEKVLREKVLRVQDLQAPVQVNRGNPITPRDVFEKLDADNSGQISPADCCLALKMLTGVTASESDLKNLFIKTGKDLNGTLLDDVKLDFECFSEMALLLKAQIQGGICGNLFCLCPNEELTNELSIFFVSEYISEGEILNPFSVSNSSFRDVYLGGTIDNTSWRELIAVPMLEEHNLSFFIPKISEGGKRFTEIEAAAMEHSSVLFFAITNTSRSIAAMAIAGHYIGKGANIVLCVEHLPENATIAHETLSESAVKDYNRGRMYLMDIAERSGVQVFTDISTAVKFVIQKCKNR